MFKRGRAEGKSETVLKLITLKFGTASAEITARIREASIEELDRYAEKILFAANVEELFRS